MVYRDGDRAIRTYLEDRHSSILPKAWIPNQAGFKFRAVLHSGSTQVVVVQRRRETGMHYVRGVRYDLIAGWTHL